MQSGHLFFYIIYINCKILSELNALTILGAVEIKILT